MALREKRTDLISLRVEPSMKATILSIASSERRTISQTVYNLLADRLESSLSLKPSSPKGPERKPSSTH